jgi:hypothetical protein
MKQQDGYVIVVLAASLVVLLGFAAMAVDTGILFSAQTALQRAADGAALAGAFTFINSPSATQPATLTNHATQTATQNKVLRAFITSGEVTVVPDLANRRVTVTISHTEGTYFAKALGFRDTTINVTAIAEASATGCGGSCVKPWFIPNTILSTQANEAAACAAGDYLVDRNTGLPNTSFFTPLLGQLFIVKPGSPQGAYQPGQFYAVTLSNDDPGGSAYRTNISTCSSAATIFCNNAYPVKTGNMIGPTKQGVDDLMTKFGTVTPDVWQGFTGPNGEAMYLHQNGSITDTSHQAVIAPIWDTCDPALVNGLHNGSNVTVTVIAFAIIFLDHTQGNDVYARLVNVSPCGGNTPGNCGSQTGPLSFPLRLVRTS